MTYDTSKELDLRSAIERFDYLIKNKRRFDLVEKRPKKSMSQIGYFHLILGWSGKHFGYTLDEMKMILKMEVVPELFYEGQVESLVPIRRWRSLGDLEKDEMGMAIDMFRRYMQENGLYLPEPSDMALLTEMETHLGKFNSLKNQTI